MFGGHRLIDGAGRSSLLCTPARERRAGRRSSRPFVSPCGRQISTASISRPRPTSWSPAGACTKVDPRWPAALCAAEELRHDGDQDRSRSRRRTGSRAAHDEHRDRQEVMFRKKASAKMLPSDGRRGPRDADDKALRRGELRSRPTRPLTEREATSSSREVRGAAVRTRSGIGERNGDRHDGDQTSVAGRGSLSPGSGHPGRARS